MNDTPLPENPVEGWYWVKTKMFHRKPFKRWVIVELTHETEDESPYVWLDANCDEFEGNIIEVGPRIPDHVEESSDGR